MADPDSFLTIAIPAEGRIREKASRFIAYVSPAASIGEAKALVSARAREHHDATHHCYAFRVEEDGRLVEFSSDAGEPKGTAGPPILAALASARLEDVVCVVSRWFGGTKLGTGGLARTYRAASEAAIKSARVAVGTRTARMVITCPFPMAGVVFAALSRLGATWSVDGSSDFARIAADVPRSKAGAAANALRGIRGVKVG